MTDKTYKAMKAAEMRLLRGEHVYTYNQWNRVSGAHTADTILSGEDIYAAGDFSMLMDNPQKYAEAMRDRLTKILVKWSDDYCDDLIWGDENE